MPTVLLYSSVDRGEPGGVQRVMESLLQQLRGYGMRVVDVHTRPFYRAAPARHVAWWVARMVRRVRFAVLLALYRPDIVNLHFISGETVFFLRLRRLFGYRLVVSAHGSDVLLPDEARRNRLHRILRLADAVTVVSNNLQDYVLRIPGVDAGKVRLIPNGIDTDFWSPAPRRARDDRRQDRRRPHLVGVGRLLHVKGFDILLDALARLRAAGLEARLTLIGDGECAQDLQALAARLGVGDLVDFRGFQGPEEIRRAFREADAFVMPSRSEGMPLALLEAMACGLPAVATRVGGVPEILTREAGLLVPPEDAKELTDALVVLLSTPGEAGRRGERARVRAQDFSNASSSAAYVSVFRETLGR
jgi:glycosyltransferase involved in cell wall biosynthesis